MKALLLTLVSALLVACSSDDGADISEFQNDKTDWVARVGDAPITASELSQLLAFYHARPGQLEKKDIDTALQQLIEEELLYREAVEKGFENHPDFLIRKRRLLAQTFRTESKRERYQDIAITEFDVRTEYDQNIARFKSPDMVRTAVVKVSEDKADYAEAIRKNTLAEVATNKGFGRWSEGTLLARTRSKGGLQGWAAVEVGPRELPEEVWNKIAAYTPGTVSGPFEFEGELYLVRIVDFKPGETKAFEVVYRDLKQELLQNEMNSIDSKYQQYLENKFDVVINEDALPDIKPATSNSTPPGFPF